MQEQSGAGDAMRYAFLVTFANDRTIDEHELKFLEKIILSDHDVDEEEKHILHNIFSRVKQNDVKPEVWQEIQRFKKEYGID